MGTFIELWCFDSRHLADKGHASPFNESRRIEEGLLHRQETP